MNTVALLSLLGDLYAEIGALRNENTRLKAEAAAAPKSNGRARKSATVPEAERTP